SLIQAEYIGSPFTFAALVALAVALAWLAFSPSKARTDEDGRLSGYVQGHDIIEDTEMGKPFLRRALIPLIRKTTSSIGALTPMKDVERIDRRLLEAGSPAGLTAPDILGIQILSCLLFSGAYLGVMQVLGILSQGETTLHLRNTIGLAALGYLMPRLWLRSRADRRKHEIQRAFPDALDLLSVSVDAGLALDSAMVRVSEHWSNALTEEFSRAILEIRVGTPRNRALQRMSDRSGVRDLATFVGVLIQSTELGVSIAHTLHVQAAQVRVRRRQHAEELARQASVKMVFALVFLIFPALLVVLLGPGLPRIFDALGGL
ncbi:MAG: type II secretion system F family protein, partial [Anaerolineae bacterium]|nr:type II secretion system F family protein [Anaerolineae bacterium]